MQAVHIDSFKALKPSLSSSDELRRARVTKELNLKKLKRDNRFITHRNVDKEDPEEILEEIIGDVEMMEIDANNNNIQQNVIKPDWIKLLFTDNVFDQLSATERISRIIFRNSEQAIKEIISQGLVERLFELVQSDQNQRLKIKAALVLTEVTTQDVKDVLPGNIVEAIENLLEASPYCVKEQAVAILGNICGDSSKLRNLFLQSRVWYQLLKLLEESPSYTMLCYGTFALSNFCYKMDSPRDFTITSQCLPLLSRFIHNEDEEVISCSCWALSHLCEGSVQMVIEAGVCSRLVELLRFRWSNKVLSSALHAIGQIVAGKESQAQVIIDCNALPALYELIQHNKIEIVRDTSWIISNILAGSENQIQAVIEADFYPTLLKLLESCEQKTQLEAAWSVRQSISRTRTSPLQIEYFVSVGCIDSLCKSIKTMNDETLRVVLRSLKVLLEFHRQEYFDEIEKLNVLDFIASLRTCENYEVSKYATKIIQYFEG